jgi:hypothetical protein
MKKVEIMKIPLLKYSNKIIMKDESFQESI